jgi:hypothetical protein
MGDPTWDQGGIEDFIRNTVRDQNPDWDSALQEATGAPSWRVGQQEYTDDAIYQEGEQLRWEAQVNEEMAASQRHEQEARGLGLERSRDFGDDVYSLPGPDTFPWNPPQAPGVPFGVERPWGGNPNKAISLPTG